MVIFFLYFSSPGAILSAIAILRCDSDQSLIFTRGPQEGKFRDSRFGNRSGKGRAGSVEEAKKRSIILKRKIIIDLRRAEERLSLSTLLSSRLFGGQPP